MDTLYSFHLLKLPVQYRHSIEIGRIERIYLIIWKNIFYEDYSNYWQRNTRHFLHIAPEDILEIKTNDSTYIAFEEGSKFYMQGLYCDTGGGAANAAAILTLLEHKVYLVCKITQDSAGAFILNDLNNRKIPIRRVFPRFDKLAQTFLSFVHFVGALTWFK